MKTQEKPIRPDITLSTGRIVRHSAMPNGATDASIVGPNPEMTEPEWEEYCAILAKRNAAFIERQSKLRRKERIKANRMAAKAWSV